MIGKSNLICHILGVFNRMFVHFHLYTTYQAGYDSLRELNFCNHCFTTYCNVWPRYTTIGDSVIAQSSKVRDLGVIFDQFLNFDDYISGVCRSTHFHLRNIGRIRHLLSYDACAQLIHALISIRLDYCNSLLYNLPKGSIERLQKIQNQAARILTKTPRCDHISEVLVSLHWLKIEQRIIYKILILTFKAFVDHTAPLYLSELVKKKSSSTNTRSANDDLLLVIPPLSRNCSNTFFERSFNFAAPTEWNRLDKRIRRISNLNTFKSEIKTILFLNYFDV